MTKKILIIASVVVLLIIGGIWVYALLHPNTSGSDGLFADFGAGSDTETSVILSDDISTMGEETGVEGEEKRLRQITTGPVAGAVFAQNGILYVVQGTGHIRYIDLVNGEDVLVSGTTIPGAYEASFSEDGEMVAITTVEDSLPKTIIAAVPRADEAGTLDGVALPLGATEVNVSLKTGTAYYLIRSQDGARGYTYGISKKTSTELFHIPLRDVHVLWGEPIYVYTTPTYTQTGYIYMVSGNDLDHVTPGATGLMALRHEDDALITRKVADEDGGDLWVSSILTSTGRVSLGVPAFPEKCVSTTHDLWCAVPSDIDSAFPDSWYKGTISLSDSLWHIDVAQRTGSLLSDFLHESGRQIDVLRIGVDTLGTRLYFINKNDNTLWIYTL